MMTALSLHRRGDSAGSARSAVRLAGLLRRSWIPALLLVWAGAAADAGPWILVDTKARTVAVMQGEVRLQQFDDISVGRGGVSDVHVLGDDTTPVGEFEIVRYNGDSRYYRFFGINYPTPRHAARALERGLIDQATFDRIDKAFRWGTPPPQNTPLGGHLGIHGIGDGSLEVHQSFNWTNGCIALTNEQIDALSLWIRVGTRVVVR